jgi:hypothetical protein
MGEEEGGRGAERERERQRNGGRERMPAAEGFLLLFLSYLGLQPLGWCHPHAEWDFPFS